MKTKELLILMVTVITLTMISGCGKKAPEREGLLIVTTIYPYELIVRQLALEDTEIVSIIPSSASPHTYSPKPEDIKKLEDASLIVSNGAGLENYLEKVLQTFEGRHIDAYSIIKEEIDTDFEHLMDNDHHHSINPHFWLDPLLIVEMAPKITNMLLLLDPANEAAYIEKLEKFEQKMHNLNFQLVVERGDLPTISVLHFHDAFYYFNNRYGINSIGAVVQSPGKEPTARELVEIGRRIKEYQVQVIFIEPQLDPKAAQVIAEEFDIRLDTLDPLGNENIAATIGDLILYNWNIMKRNIIE